MQKDAYRVWEMLTGTRFMLEIEGNKLRISPVAQEGAYEDLLAECFQEYGAVFCTPELTSFGLDLYEQVISVKE